MVIESILGINVSVITSEELKTDILQKIDNKQKFFIASANPEIMLQSKEQPDLKQIINNAEIAIPDGIGVVYASKILGGKIRERITGIDVLYMLCEIAVQKNLSVFLYGAKPGVAEKAAANLEKQYPGLKVAGYINGYEKDNQKILAAINSSDADIIFVGLGAPLQEYWIANNKDKICPDILECVGGSFDVISGNLKRAPKWVQNCNLEWLYRLMLQPSRFFRQLKLITFVIEVIKSKHK